MKLYLQRKEQGDAHSVILRLRVSGQIYNTTLCNIRPENWNYSLRCLNTDGDDVGGTPLREWEDRLNDIHDACRNYIASLSPVSSPSLERIRSIVADSLERPRVMPTLSADYNTYILERNNSRKWHEKTLLRERYVMRLFLEYAGDSRYEDFTPGYMESFVGYLEKTRDMKGENLHKVVVSVYGFLHWAAKHGRYPHKGEYTYRFSRVKKSIVYLSKEELKRIVEYKIPPSGTIVRIHDMHGRLKDKRVMGAEYMSVARDYLLFGCLTGLRYSEIQALRESNIRSGETIFFVAKKTDTRRDVELNKYAKAIIKKYSSSKSNVEDGFIFPRLSNQKANVHLHDLAELCEINEPVSEMKLVNGEKTETLVPKFQRITTHIGRKTFVCQALLARLSPELITLWTGHASVDDMRPYMAAASEAGASGMKQLFRNMFVRGDE